MPPRIPLGMANAQSNSSEVARLSGLMQEYLITITQDDTTPADILGVHLTLMARTLAALMDIGADGPGLRKCVEMLFPYCYTRPVRPVTPSPKETIH